MVVVPANSKNPTAVCPRTKSHSCIRRIRDIFVRKRIFQSVPSQSACPLSSFRKRTVCCLLPNHEFEHFRAIQKRCPFPQMTPLSRLKTFPIAVVFQHIAQAAGFGQKEFIHSVSRRFNRQPQRNSACLRDQPCLRPRNALDLFRPAHAVITSDAASI